MLSLPVHALDRFAHAEPAAELVEGVAMARIGAVKVFAFGDQFQLIVARDGVIVENPCEGTEIGGVDH